MKNRFWNVCLSKLQWWSLVSSRKTCIRCQSQKNILFQCNKLLPLLFKKTDNTTGAVIEKTVAKLSSFAQRLTFDKNENMEDRRELRIKKMLSKQKCYPLLQWEADSHTFSRYSMYLKWEISWVFFSLNYDKLILKKKLAKHIHTGN